MKTKIKLWVAVFFTLFIANNPRAVLAALNGSLMQTATMGEEVVSYVLCDSGIDSAEMQIAQYPCEDVKVVMPEDISVHTVIMVDNSLSVTESNRENIKNILRRYVEGMSGQEAVSLAVFGEEIQFLSEKSQEKENLLRLIDEIEFHNQDTYLTDYLYEELEKIENDSDYTRFIIISDGVDNKAIGITKEELYDKLKEISRPVYAVGHIYKDNETELKNMFALSRMTNGMALMIEDYAEASSIADEVHDFSDLYLVSAKIPQEVRDGDRKNILLKLHAQEGELEVTGTVRMPFGAAPEEEEKENVRVEVVKVVVPEIVTKQDEETQPDFEMEKGTGGGSTGRIVVFVVLVIALIATIVTIVLLAYRKKHKAGTNQDQKNMKQSDKKQKDTKHKGKKSGENKAVTPVVPVEPKPMPESEGSETVFLDGRYLLVLRDRQNPDRIFRYPMDGHVAVGRNVDMVQIAIDYSRTVSKRHCEFYARNHRFFIRDMNSANHTYVDGRLVNSETEIQSGSIVRIGEVEFGVEIMPI